MYRYFLGIIIFLFFGFYSVSLGQSFNIPVNISIDASPRDPEPNEEVTISLSSYEADLDISSIKWSYGSLSESGLGQKEFKIKAPNEPGSRINVKAEITLADGETVNQEINIQVNSYDILWESTSAKTIPFYMGKKIPTRENNIRVAVINPDINTTNTSYTWSKNGKVMQSGKGIKNYFDFKNSELDKKEDVLVRILNNGSTAERSLKIPFTQPKILFFEYHPIFGINLGQTITETAMSYEETTSILAVPVGINKGSKTEIMWELSNTPVSNQQNPYLISFGIPDDSGIVPLSVNIENLNSLYQIFKGSLRLRY